MSDLKKSAIAAYAALAAPLKALTLTTTLYLPAFYAAEANLGLTRVGLIFLVLRVFDIVIDPGIGWLSDRTEVSFGRRRFWILLGIFPLALAVWKVFRPHIPADPASVLGWLALFYLAWTVVTVSHTAWAVDLTEDKNLLRRLIGWREWAGIAGMLAIMIGPAIEERHGHSLSTRMATLGGSLAISLLIATLLALVAIPQRPTGRSSNANLLQILVCMRSSRQLQRVLLADLLAGCGFGMASALMLFVAKDRLNIAASFSSIMLGYFIGMLLSVPAWIRCADRVGTRSTYRIAMKVLATAQLLILLLPQQQPVVAGILWFLQGTLTGAYQFGLNGVMAETAERDREQSGETIAGLYFALLATTNKVGYAFAIGTVYPLIDALGFSPRNAGKGISALVFTYAILPAVFFAASAWTLPHTEEG